MRKTILGRAAAALCLLCITGTVLSGCGSKNADSAATVAPAGRAAPATTTSPAPAVGTPSGNPVGDAYRDGVVAAHQKH